MFDEPSGGVLTWTPADDQLGPFYLPYTCTDDAAAPAVAAGQLTFRVSALDSCTIPSCDPAAGCTVEPATADRALLHRGPVARVAEPAVGCPDDRVLYVGQNANGFGRIQNCDVMVVENFEQSGAEVQFDVETRCLNSLTRIGLETRMDSNAANHPLMFDVLSPRFLFTARTTGSPAAGDIVLSQRRRSVLRRRGRRGQSHRYAHRLEKTGLATAQVRVRLSFTPRPDLPDVDPTPLPTATRTPVP